jgi:menaquinone-dependent protoporphyrinogen oxidase
MPGPRGNEYILRMETKVKALIVFDTKHGATEEIAKRIAQAVRDHRGEADLLDLRTEGSRTPELGAYDAVALGAPFYMGRWSKRARAFAESRQGELGKKRIALFAVGSNAKLGDLAAKASLPKSLADKVAFSAYFGGRFDFNSLGALERRVIKKVTGQAESSSTLDLEATKAFGEKLVEPAGR